MVFGIVYEAINNINNKIYIGITTTSLHQRRLGHLSDSRVDKPKFRFQKAIKKYGEENFSWLVLAKCYSEEELKDQEKFFIEKKKSYIGFENSNGYNMTKGGDNNPMFDAVIKKKHRINTKKALANPIIKQKQCLNTKIALSKPDVKKRHIAGCKKSWTNERKKHYSIIGRGSNNNAKYLWKIFKNGLLILETKCLKDWCKDVKLNYNSVYGAFSQNRIFYGYKIKRIRMI